MNRYTITQSPTDMHGQIFFRNGPPLLIRGLIINKSMIKQSIYIPVINGNKVQ